MSDFSDLARQRKTELLQGMQETAEFDRAVEQQKPRSFQVLVDSAQEAADLLRQERTRPEIVAPAVGWIVFCGNYLFQGCQGQHARLTPKDFSLGIIVDTHGRPLHFLDKSPKVIDKFDTAIKALGTSPPNTLEGLDDIGQFWRQSIVNMTGRVLAGVPYR